MAIPHLPRRGSLMIWRAGGWFKHTGHVAVVTEVIVNSVEPDPARGGNVVRGVIRVAEQNVHDRSWGGRTYSRELPFGIAPDGTLTVLDTYPNTVVLGWVTSLTTGAPIPLH
jgi:glutathionylspermidine amidase/synthetase